MIKQTFLYNTGYGGKNCSENTDDCQSNSCLNNGVCVDLVNDHLCNCTDGKYQNLSITSICIYGKVKYDLKVDKPQ